MKYFAVVFALIGLFGVSLSVPVNPSFNGTFAWLNDGVTTGSCGIYYNTLRDKIAIISDKWFTSDSVCKCNLKIDYQGKSITVPIRGGSADDELNKVELSYAAFYALNPSNGKGYDAVFTFVDCQK